MRFIIKLLVIFVIYLVYAIEKAYTACVTEQPTQEPVIIATPKPVNGYGYGYGYGNGYDPNQGSGGCTIL